jgi:DNA-binding PadR family transcriptional regulator
VGARRVRGNPLALAVLLCLGERPMHPYEIATTLRQRHQHESLRLNYGSLYAVVASLERRGLIVARATQRDGRHPERTVYALAETGTLEAQDWLTDLLSTPGREYPIFQAALSFLPALPPALVVSLLEERARHLELEIATGHAARELARGQSIPRLHWVEEEYRGVLREAEFAFVRQLCADIASGALEGTAWWEGIHASELGEMAVRRRDRSP